MFSILKETDCVILPGILCESEASVIYEPTPDKAIMTHPLEQQLDQMITGYWTSQAIYAAAKLGIADLLKDGPRSVEQLAKDSLTDPDSLYRLLRALASIEIFSESSPRSFSLTPIAQRLRRDVEGSKRALALMTGEEQFQAWGEIVYSIQTGKTAFDKVFGKPIFDYLGDNPDKGQIFDDAMTGIHGRETGALLDAYDFSGTEILADIGGGNGSNIIAIMEANPAMKGILFDLPHVVERAKERVFNVGLSGRCRLECGDFFESVPSGADTYILRHIIHDWDDEKSLAILRNCHSVIPANGKLLIIESVIPQGNQRFAGKFLDLVMLLIPGGKERTKSEYNALLEQAGFELRQIVPTNSELSVLECARR